MNPSLPQATGRATRARRRHLWPWLLPWGLGALVPAALAQERNLWYDEGDYGFGGGSEGWDEEGASGRWPRVRGQIPEFHVVRRGDTLWDISHHFYGDPWRWPEIWSYNPEITNPHWIYPDDQVKLRARGTASASQGALAAQPVAASHSSSEGDVTPPAGHAFGPETVFLRDQGYLDADALRQAGQVDGSPEERMLLATGDDIYVKFAKGQEVRVGERYTIFREMPKAERLPREEGRLVRIYGMVLVRSYDREHGLARGVVTEALDPIERGDRVAVMARRFDLVQPRRNEADAEGRVVATLRPRTLLSHDNLVFLDIGAEQGVQAGNRVFILRKGDRWRDTIHSHPTRMGATVDPPAYDVEHYPDEVTTEGRVVHVRPRSCAVLLTRSLWEVEVGDRAEIRRGFE